MTTTSSTLHDYVEGHRLGHLVLYTISDQPVSHTVLEQAFDELGLDKRFLPPANKKQHAFEKATSDVHDTYRLSGDRTAKTLCRPVSKARDVVIRQITREVQDSRRRQLDYHEIITVRFYRPTHNDQSTARLLITLNPDHLEEEELPAVRTIAQSIKQRYDRYYEFLDGQKVRALVRNYLRHLNSIEIKGGVYFIHSNRDEELGRLRQLVHRLSGCSLDQIPVLDLDSQRDFITRAFEREADQALQDLIRDIGELDRERKVVTPAAYARMKVRYEEIIDNATEHLLKLRSTRDVTTESVEAASTALTMLQRKLPTPREEGRDGD